MKSTLFPLALVFFIPRMFAQDPVYRVTVDSAHRRLAALDHQSRGLSPAQKKERFTLIGRLITEDPVWALTRDVAADIEALRSGNSDTSEDRATIEKLQQLLGIAGAFEQRATTLAEARSIAAILRQFIVRRDVDGARSWARAQ